MKIYIAAKYQRRHDPEVQDFARHLRYLGHEITSRWLDGGEEGKGIVAAALMDVEDVRRAEALIFLGEPQASENRGGGRWFEFGMAYQLGLKCIAVLNMDPSKGGHDHLPTGHESVFTALPEIEIVHSLPEALKLRGIGG